MRATETDPAREATALEEGRAFVDLSTRRTIQVSGGDARAWLGDLVTSDVASLEPGRSHRSLLLGPTGGIRADFTLAMDGERFLLVQTPNQPDVAGLLERYVLSSDVSLADVTGDVSWLAVPGTRDRLPEARSLAPSALGTGVDLIAPHGEPADRLREELRERGIVEASLDAAEILRVRRGDPRIGVDFEPEALPMEAGLDAAVDATKGCFLGQESVARVRNLGHARSVLRHLTCPGALEAGSEVIVAGSPVGLVTSAAPSAGGGTVAIVRLPWEAAGGPWATAEGTPLESLGRAD